MSATLREMVAQRAAANRKPTAAALPPTPLPIILAANSFQLPKVNSTDDLGLTSGLVGDLVLKALYIRGQITPLELVEWLKVPYYGVLETVLRDLSNQDLCYISSGQSMSPLSYVYTIATQGQTRAQEVMARNAYVGPAPVTLDDYWASVAAQSLEGVEVHEHHLRQAFANLIMDEDLLEHLGPAANSARSMFLYGSPGNGKTAIAEALVRMLGGDIYIPHAIEVQGEIVRVYDPVHHPLVNPGQPESVDDPRWVHVRRPVVTVGGELTLPTLDLIYNEASRYYEAPFQMKANNGAFFIDDFGRQQVSPRDLLNRWIVPLENRVDFLSLRTGQKMEVPFDTLVIFSTNLDPTDLVDEAFLRRIRYKVEIKSPGEVQFKEIFRRVCAAKGVGCDEDVLDYLCTVKYPELGVEPRAVHPRDLVEQVVDYCRYKELPLQLTNGLLDIACSNYFVHLEM